MLRASPLDVELVNGAGVGDVVNTGVGPNACFAIGAEVGAGVGPDVAPDAKLVADAGVGNVVKADVELEVGLADGAEAGSLLGADGLARRGRRHGGGALGVDIAPGVGLDVAAESQMTAARTSDCTAGTSTALECKTLWEHRRPGRRARRRRRDRM